MVLYPHLFKLEHLNPELALEADDYPVPNDDAIIPECKDAEIAKFCLNSDDLVEKYRDIIVHYSKVGRFETVVRLP